MQSGQILRNEAYLQNIAITEDATQRRSWTLYEFVKIDFSKLCRFILIDKNEIKSSHYGPIRFELVNLWYSPKLEPLMDVFNQAFMI